MTDGSDASALGRYARLETERRFLVSALPPGAVRTTAIEDRYLTGTRLRLRAMTTNGTVVRKLGQKVRVDGARRIAHTTIYLDESEWSLLRVLPAHLLTKTRHHYPDGTAIDEHLDGTLIAEVNGGDAVREPPSWLPIVREVTDEEAFTGAALAARTLDG